MKMTVRTPVDEFKQVLINRYSMESLIPEDTWPVVNQNTFIKLAVVKEKCTYREGTFTYQAIAGNAYYWKKPILNTYLFWSCNFWR